ncbi:MULTISPECIES: DUF3000 domain-containing protein [Corynebacterium]|uniref:Membrane protein n=1 Tax=Corynebacterium auriscanis TaxID=99807 RepID=A0A0A2DNX3_9CORY|nr:MULTISPECIES: DUF3000 domain-containing protein [Corynebacterium]KGM19442.1 membrane protein [Corynebacterium auriscanis]MCX2162950.1 DUF3000 domain-containing protein [Corynebacterium auriscanis]OFT89711.1 hypothetical protein HMPREF3098_05195 [Corynebacterium sp. HMSC28B08]WJY72810.1 hypothetical protein CAURIC_05920 [Corynebacterium auriscanis]
MSQDTEIPQYFHEAVRSMTEAEVRSGIQITDIRPPRNLAPLSHAVGLEVVHTIDSTGETAIAADSSGHDAFGRLILLHDPASEEHWRDPSTTATSPKMRMVAYIQADMDASVAADPLLPDVAWDWLTEQLDGPGCTYTDLGGTVTSTASVRYGEIGGPPRAFQLEMRASWTAVGADLSAHVTAFSHVLANVAGLPPEGVAAPRFGVDHAREAAHR